jgi:hypothetical protein
MAYTVSVGHAQADGRRYVLEIHSDGSGEFARVEYLAAEGADTDAIASARDAQLLLDFAEAEVGQAVEVDHAPALRFQTGADFLARLRELYRASNKERCARIARWVIRRLDAGDVTAAQLRNVFDLTVLQWDALETKMRNLAASLDAVEAAEGE